MKRFLALLLCMPSAALSSGFQGTWTSGFQHVAIPELGAAAFLEHRISISETEVLLGTRVLIGFLGSLNSGAESTIHMQILHATTERRESGTVLVRFTGRLTDVTMIERDPLKVREYSDKKTCGITQWPLAAPVSLLGTPCVKGDAGVAMEFPLLLKGNAMYAPITMEPVPATQNHDADDILIDVTGELEQGEEDLNLELPFWRL